RSYSFCRLTSILRALPTQDHQRRSRVSLVMRAPARRWDSSRGETFAAVLSQQAGGAEGSLTRAVPGTAAAALTMETAPRRNAADQMADERAQPPSALPLKLRHPRPEPAAA